jgi:hypothetical protein
MDLGFVNPPVGHPLFKPAKVSQQPCLLLVSDRPVLGLTPFAAAQDVKLVGRLPARDPDSGFLLSGIGRGGLSKDLLPTLLLLELVEPLQALRLPASHDIVMATGSDLLQIVVEGHATVHDHRATSPTSGPLLQNP